MSDCKCGCAIYKSAHGNTGGVRFIHVHVHVGRENETAEKKKGGGWKRGRLKSNKKRKEREVGREEGEKEGEKRERGKGGRMGQP